MPCHPESRAAIGFLANTFQVNRTVLIVATECTKQIGRITTSGDVTEYSATGGTSGQIQGIAVGSDGALWFAANFFSCPFRGFICTGGAQIGRITTAGDLTILVPPTSDGSPLGIAAGPDNALWFTETSEQYWKGNRRPKSSGHSHNKYTDGWIR
jgi:streptogramin lyase